MYSILPPSHNWDLSGAAAALLQKGQIFPLLQSSFWSISLILLQECWILGAQTLKEWECHQECRLEPCKESSPWVWKLRWRLPEKTALGCWGMLDTGHLQPLHQLLALLPREVLESSHTNIHHLEKKARQDLKHRDSFCTWNLFSLHVEWKGQFGRLHQSLILQQSLILDGAEPFL